MPSKTSKKRDRKSKPAPKPAAPPPAPDNAKVAQVLLWIVQGQTETIIAEAIRAQWTELDPHALIKAAWQLLEKSTVMNIAQVKGWCIEAYRELHRRLTEMGDYAAAIRAVAKVEAIVDEARKIQPPDETAQTSPDESAARAHLAPLFEQGDTLPLAELARLAATKILNAAP